MEIYIYIYIFTWALKYTSIYLYIMNIQYIYIELLNILFESGTVDISTVHFFSPVNNRHPSQICKKKPSWLPVWMEPPGLVKLQVAIYGSSAFDVFLGRGFRHGLFSPPKIWLIFFKWVETNNSLCDQGSSDWIEWFILRKDSVSKRSGESCTRTWNRMGWKGQDVFG